MHLLPKTRVPAFLEALAARFELYGPQVDASGETLFDRAADPAAIRLDAPIPYNPVKSVLFPQTETVLSYSYDRETKTAAISRPDVVRPKAFVGVRPCDLTGILCLDRFYLGQEFVDEVYRDHRKRLFIVANTCVRPFAQCFCVCTDSGPAAGEGYDLNLTDLGKEYLVEVGSEKGAALAAKLSPAMRARISAAWTPFPDGTLQFVFASLALLFFLLAFSDFSGSAGLKTFAGYEGIVCGASAIYTGLAQVLNAIGNEVPETGESPHNSHQALHPRRPARAGPAPCLEPTTAPASPAAGRPALFLHRLTCEKDRR